MSATNGEQALSTTVVISAAGRGTRLGQQRPKCLVEVLGRTVLAWQLDALGDIDVVLVVGFRSDDVMSHARGLRPDIRFAQNPDFATTGTAASLAIGAAAAASEMVVSLDGDLIVAPDDLGRFVRPDSPANAPLVGVTLRASVTAVGATVDERNGVVTDMDFAIESPWEWSGLLRMQRIDMQQFGRRHVFEGVRPHLPLASIAVDCVEIDEPVDLDRAAEWLRQRTKEGRWIGT